MEPTPTEKPPTTVLVVDDQPSIRTLLERLLRVYGFMPLVATDGSTAASMADGQHVDAFIIDLHLAGGRSGLDVLTWVRRQERYAATPVFVLTGDRAMPDEEHGLIRRHHGQVFYKGESLRLLLEQLQRVLGDGKAG